MRWWKLKFNLRSLHRRSSLGCSPQPLSRRLPATQHAHFIGQDGRTRTEREAERQRGKKEFKKWRSQSCEKKSVLLHRSRPLARSAVLSLFHCSAARPRAVVGEFFPQRTNSPTFCCSGVFPSPSRTREGGEKVDISRDAALSLSIRASAAVTRRSPRPRPIDEDGRTRVRRTRWTGGSSDVVVRASPLKERKRERVNPGKDAKPPPQGHHFEGRAHLLQVSNN